MINYLYTIFRQAFRKSDYSFFQSFIVFILFGFGGIFSIILSPFGIDPINTMVIAISIAAILFSVYLIY